MDRKQEIADELNVISTRVLGLYEARKTDKPDVYNFTPEETQEIKDSEPKMAALRDELKGINDTERTRKLAEEMKQQVNAPETGMRFPGSAPGEGEQSRGFVPQKSLGQLFVESNAFKGYNRAVKAGPEVAFELKDVPSLFESKTVVDTATAYQPQAIRTGFISPYPTRKLAVIDIIPQGMTDQIAVVYMEETTFTNNAVETAESSAAGEAAIAFTQRTANVKKIPVYIPITDELMEDAPMAESYVNNRLGYMVRARLDSQLIVGDGTGENLTGLLNVSGNQTQAVSSDSEADAAHKAMTKVEAVGFADPDYFVLHPNNWQKIRLVKTSNGEYIYGAPWEAGPGTLWGLPVLSTTAITAGTGLVGGFAPWCQYASKKALTMSVGYINDQFIKGQLCVKAELRGAFPVYRPSAFCRITGMGS